jgi:glycosyltransferase involved in cell wall biosynthesis
MHTLHGSGVGPATLRKRQSDRHGAAADNQLRVLHVITGLHSGGAETALYRLVMHTPHIRHEVISISSPDWYSPSFADLGVPVHYLNADSFASMIMSIPRLGHLIRTSECDVLQAWMYRPNLLAGLLGRLNGKPVIWNIRASAPDLLGPASRFLVYAGGLLARWLPDFVINCSTQSAQLHALWGYDAAECGVIPNGYDPALFRPNDEARSHTRAALGIPAGRFCLGTVARWHPQKGYSVLLEAAGLLRKRGIDFTLLLAGSGMNYENSGLTGLIRKNSCDDIVQLLGARNDVPELDRAFDLHVLASAAEGFPNVVAESMLSGTPNVVTDVGDAALIVGESGWVVPPNDAVALADAIEAAFNERNCSPGNWEKRREAARKRIMDSFSLERMARAYEGVWAKVAGRYVNR